MGFYGNITNTARTQFQFDKIYPNRYEMEQKTKTDGIYAGRYVLIEYDSDVHLDHMLRVWHKADGWYTQDSNNVNILLKEGNIAVGELVYTASTEIDRNDPRAYKNCVFYKCVGFKNDVNKTAKFEEVVNGSSDPNTPAYTVNYNIDTNVFGAGRGYDSTVWQKTYSAESGEKYVMIAELNTVVPTFDVAPDAPSMNPVVPHFDTQSTDVYYKLHWQAPWGFRVKETDNNKSDEDTEHTTTVYDPDTGKNNIVTWRKVPAAIYFNKAAFDAQVDENRTSEAGINKHSNNVIVNEIKVEPTGKSGNKYNDHNNASTQSAQVDIQEMTINLPSIGNMMSDAWDIIHGPLRNDDMREIDPKTGDYVASLKGRLDSIDAIASDEIPVKRHDNGQLVGSKINGGKTSEDDKTGINDDAWIQTIVDAATNTISIHHMGPVSGYVPEVIDNKYLAFGGKFNINDHYFDEKGHKFASQSYTVTIPSLSLIINDNDNDNGNVVTGLSLAPKTGVFTETKANLGDIKLGTYKGDDDSDNLAADITLQQALSRLYNKINKEASICSGRDSDIYHELSYDITDLLGKINTLQTKLNNLEAKVNKYHPLSGGVEPQTE